MKVLFIYSFFKTKQNQTKICTVCNVCLRLSLKVHTHHHNSSWAWLSEKVCHAHCAPPQKNYFAFVNLCHRCPHQKIIISSLNTLQQSLFYVTFIEFIRRFHEFFVTTNLRNCQDTEFVYLFLCTLLM